MNGLYALIPIMALSIPLLAIVVKSDLGRALADRLRHGPVPMAPPAADPAILEELDHIRAELSELHERIEFAERLLAKPDSSTPVTGA